MRYWLMKSEPSVYGIDDLARDRRTSWDGIRNYQVRNMLRDEFAPGDRAFFYHSSCDDPGIVGTMEVAGCAVPDPSQFDRKSDYYDPRSTRDNPTWLAVEVAFARKLPRVITLDDLKSVSDLRAMQVLRRGNRLSITPVTVAEWRAIERLA
jgi:predicted RNA-binding protein with PUA-like domain